MALTLDLSAVRPKNYSNKPVDELSGIFIFLGLIWLIFFLDQFLPITEYGLLPRHFSGLIGIITMPLIHQNFAHLIGNTIPLIILLLLLTGSRARSAEIVFVIVILGGILLWNFGRPAIHIGASSLVFGLIAFLISSGVVERRFISMMAALIVGGLFGTTLFLGILPGSSDVSWDGHLTGTIAGVVCSLIYVRPKLRK